MLHSAPEQLQRCDLVALPRTAKGSRTGARRMHRPCPLTSCTPDDLAARRHLCAPDQHRCRRTARISFAASPQLRGQRSQASRKLGDGRLSLRVSYPYPPRRRHCFDTRTL